MPSEQLNRKSWLIVKSSAEVPGRHLRIRSGNQAHPAARDAALRHHVSRAGIRSSGMPAAVRLSSHDVRREHIDRRFPHFHSADDDSSLPCHHSLSVGTIRARRDLRFFLRSSLLFISTRPDSWGVESRPSQLNPFVLVYVPQVLTESLSIIVALAAAGFFFRLVEKAGRYLSVFLCAVLAGYLMEIRPANLGISLAFLIGISTVFFYHSRRAAVSKRQLLFAAAVLFVGFVLPISIQVSINWVVHADLTPLAVFDFATWHLWHGTYRLKQVAAFWDDRWHSLRYVSPWVSDPSRFQGAVLSFYIDHPWKALKTCVVHLYGALDYDVFWVYNHEPKYINRGMHLTPETPTYSMRGCGGLPADAGGV